MKGRQWKKLICLLLALEMLCAPLTPTALSAGAEPEDTGQGPPAPILEERPEPTPVPTADVVPTAEPTPVPTADVTPTVEPSSVPTAEGTPTSEPTAEPTPTPTADVVPTAGPTPVPTADVVPTAEPTPTATTESVQTDWVLDADNLQVWSAAPLAAAAADPAWRYVAISPNYYRYIKTLTGSDNGDEKYVLEVKEDATEQRAFDGGLTNDVNSLYKLEPLKILYGSRVPNYELEGWYAHKLEDAASFFTTYNSVVKIKTAWSTLTKGEAWDKNAAETDVRLDKWDSLEKWDVSTIPIDDDLKDIKSESYSFGTKTKTPVLLVYANWVPSKNATITTENFSLNGVQGGEGAALQMFSQPIQGKNTTATTSGDSNGTTADDGLGRTDWDPDNVTTYYARALPEQEYAKFEFDTYEPGARVTVTLQFGGETIYRETVSVPEKSDEETGGETTTRQSVAPSLIKTLRNGPSTDRVPNTWTNPARAIWTLTVPLAYSDGAAGVDSIYNVVTIKVESPDAVANGATAENTKTYTFNIQRLRDPELVQEIGNTAAGLAREELPKRYRYEGVYGAGAWPDPNDNPDEDVYAVAVYLDSAVALPGLALVDSEGFRTDLGKGGSTAGNIPTLKYSLQINGARDRLTTAVFTDPTQRKALYYIGDRFVESNAARGTLAGEKMTLDLKSTVVCPGRYSIEYEFTDPVTGETYTSTDLTKYYETDKAATFARTLLVLAEPGDVDMDGAVTPADAILLREAIESSVSFVKQTDANARLFTYRVCDVNKDGEVNKADVDAIFQGFVPSLFNHDYFYTPWNWTELEEGVKQKDRVVASGSDHTKAHLSVEYLGIEGVEEQPGVELGNVFWVGVKLSNLDTLTEKALYDKVKSFTISLSYDSNYLCPALEEAGSEAKVVYTYASANEDIWGSGYDFSHSIADQRITPHSTKATTELVGDSRFFREIRVILELTDGAAGKTLQELKDGYILKLPFVLKQHPRMEEPKLLEATLGMRELNLTTVTGDKTSTTTAAWSMADSIYGRATLNLADYVDYCGTEPIPIGEDQTPATVIDNAVYGTPFSYDIGSSDDINAFLPKGLTQSVSGGNTLGLITGIPQEVGTFEFYYCPNLSTALRYILIVNKAPLTVWVDDQEKYYGEDNPELTFSYDTSQVKDVDSITNPEFFNVRQQGDQEALKKLKGYQAPTVTTDVIRATEAGEYEILLDGGAMESDHYVFRFVDGPPDTETDPPDGEAAEQTTESRGTLTVYKRPLWLQKVTKNPVGNLFSGDLVLILSERGRAEGYYRQNDFTVATPELTDGKYGNAELGLPELPLTADETIYGHDDLRITFDAVFRADNPAPPYFEMNGQGQKMCEADVDNVLLDETYGAAKNYALMMVQAPPVSGGQRDRGYTPRDPQAQGLVLAQKVIGIQVAEQLDRAVYTHGDTLSLSGLAVTLTYEKMAEAGSEAGETEVKNLRWSGEGLFAENGVSVYWAQPDGKGGYDLLGKASHGQELSRNIHDGAYLCVSVATFEDDGNGNMVEVELRAYTAAPVTVGKRELTLYLAKQDRYYGEDNADFTVTYDLEALSPEDRVDRTGSITDFDSAPLAGYKAPTITVLDGQGRPVDRSTGVGSYTVSISGAASSDYNIRYAAAENREAKFPTTATNVLTIHPRPIIVTKVLAQAPFIYVDTQTVAGTGMTTINDVALNYGGSTQEFIIARPQQGDRYYYQTQRVEDHYETAQKTVDMSLTGDAVLEGDSLKLSYRAEYIRDNENTRGEPYFTLSPDNAYEERPVQVKDIKLLDAGSAGNYTLVFTRNDNASGGLPGSAAVLVEEERQTTGEVRWRTIKKLEITSLPKKLEYTYGEVLELSGLSVRITSENDGVGGGKPLVRDIEYRAVTSGDTNTNTFAQAGLWVSWDSSDGATAAGGEYVTVAERNGATLIVSAQRQGSHELLTASVTKKVVVHKKALTLTVQPQYKYYGESNREYGFTFELSDLAIPDREKVAGLPLTGSVIYDEFGHPEGNSFAYALTAERLAAELAKLPAESAALAKLNEAYESTTAYVGPVFASGCTAHSNVTGNYPLTLSGGAMANYEFVYKPSTTTVFRRPIRVAEITKDPIYKPFRGTEIGKTYNTECLYVDGGAEPRQEFRMESLYTGAQGMDNIYDPAYVQQMGTKKLQRNAVDVLPGDTVGIRMKLTLDSMADSDCAFTVSEMQLTSGSANYCLYYRNGDTATNRQPDITGARGSLETRNITSVEIVSEPRFDYTYNQLGQGQNLGELNLSQLRIKITYQGEEGQTAPNEIVTASEKEGIYISYWPADKTVSSDPADWQTIVRDYRPAATGDHLTIAKDASGFAHNGMKLIISAQATSDMDFVKPVVTTGTIKVAPLDLTYALSAQDKVYDGTRNATGTITLLNVYGGDEVYVDTGVTYSNFAGYASEHGYAFTSAADSARTALKFDFKDADVAYQTAPTHDNYGDLATKVVEVRGIRLSGKDAANYKINTEVLEGTQQIVGRDGAPRATITKAQRTLEDLTILLTTDMNTNTVEVSVAEDVLTKGDRNDAHNKKPELHYEYALEYLDPMGAPIVLPYQDGRYFGGEAVTVDNGDADASALPPEGSGAGQAINRSDTDFGTREPLPRGTYFRALVRVAETHNYEASNFVASVEDLAAAIAEAEAAEAPAPDENVKSPRPMAPSPLGKTYRYRIDLLSTYEVKSAQGGQSQKLKALEGVWFNDIEEYKDSRALDLAVDNLETVRYHGFYLDGTQSKSVSFPLNMAQALQTQEPGTPAQPDEPSEPLPEDTLQIFVALKAPTNGVAIRSIKISPETVIAAVGGAPIQLTVEYTPKSATTKKVTWSSSDESVVTVDKDGVLTFVGVGEAVVTAITRNRKTASVTVVVREHPFVNTLFNVNYSGTYFELDEDYNFHPDDQMTRGEAAEVLAKFLLPAADGELEQAEAFVDVDSTMPYADAVSLLRVRGIVQGVGANYFDGERYVTREEVAAMLGRMLLLGREETVSRVHAFVDCTEEDSWGYAYVDDLAQAGIAQGGSSAYFYPGCAATRAELATFIARILMTEADGEVEELLRPSDMTAEHWAYSSVLRAINSTLRYKGAD